jgi:hypothetical protein
MRPVILRALVVLAAAACRAAEADPASDALQQKAELCIRSQAPAAAAVSPNPNDAVSFLIDGLCAVEVERAQSYIRNTQMLAGWRADSDRPDPLIAPGHTPTPFEQSRIDAAAATAAQLKTMVVDPSTGELNTPACFNAPIGGTGSAMLTSLTAVLSQTARFRMVAASAVLAADQASPHR